MADCILELWHFTSTEQCSAIIVPDGCRDIILSKSLNGLHTWRITDLDHCSRDVYIAQNVDLVGIRLRPGTEIIADELPVSRAMFEYDEQALRGWVNDHCHLEGAVAETLEALRSQPRSVTKAAQGLGVTPRTLQRFLVCKTGQPPSFWLQLARVRQAAQALQSPIPLVEVAALHGYADQAHMSRDIKRWFGVTPSELQSTEQFERLFDSGYD